MATPTERRLSEILDELQALLAGAEDLDASDRDALHDASEEIRSVLEDDDEEGSRLDAIRERIERFETDHPSLTEVVRRLVDQLADMGI